MGSLSRVGEKTTLVSPYLSSRSLPPWSYIQSLSVFFHSQSAPPPLSLLVSLKCWHDGSLHPQGREGES